MRCVQVLETEVRAGVHLRAVLRLGARGDALRGGAQGVRSQQRVEAASQHPGAQAARRRGHHLLRGSGSPQRPSLWLRRQHLRPPATGDEFINTIVLI